MRNLKDELRVTVIATGFGNHNHKNEGERDFSADLFSFRKRIIEKPMSRHKESQYDSPKIFEKTNIPSFTSDASDDLEVPAFIRRQNGG